MRLALTFAIIMFAGGLAIAEQSMENARHGYTLEIPDGWHEVPSDFIGDFSKSVSGPGQPINYVGGYQKDPFDGALVYPYILVQSITYRDFGLDRTPTIAEKGLVLKAIIGMDVTEALADTPAADVTQVSEGQSPLSLISFDDATGTFIYDLKLAIANVGDVRGRVRGVFGRRALLQTAYYALESDWSAREDESNSIVESFAFLPDYADPSSEQTESEVKVTVEDASSVAKSNVSFTMLVAAGLAGVVLIVIALFVLLRANARRS